MEALAEFGEEELEAALDNYQPPSGAVEMQAATENDTEGSVQGQDDDSMDMSVGSVGGAGGETEEDKDEGAEDLIVCSQKFEQALMGMKVHDAGV